MRIFQKSPTSDDMSRRDHCSFAKIDTVAGEWFLKWSRFDDVNCINPQRVIRTLCLDMRETCCRCDDQKNCCGSPDRLPYKLIIAKAPAFGHHQVSAEMHHR